MPKPKGKSKYSEKQMKIARVAEPRDKITGADFKAMKGFEDGGEVDLDKLPRSMKKKTRTGLFSSEFTDVKETKKPRTKAQKEAVQSEMDELRAKGAMSFPRPDSVSVEEKARAKKLVRQENRRSRAERRTQEEAGSFKDGGPVYRDPPMEPVTGEEETSAFMDEMLFEDRRLKDKKSREEYKKTSRRGDDEPVKTYRDGGMVRGCKGIQVKGKKFSGTF